MLKPADLGEIAWVSSLGAVAVGLVGLVVAWTIRRRSIRWQVLLVAVVAAGGTYAGALAIADRMFLSQHDLTVITVVTSASAVAGILVALFVGLWVVSYSRRLERAVESIGPGSLVVDALHGPQEIRQLSGALADAQARLELAREREARLEESRREWVSWVSHDLRTPLAGLRAMAEALEDGLAPDPARYHRQIRDEVERLAALVDDLFELSRIQAGALALHPQTVALGDAISGALAAAEPVARERGVRLDGQCDEALEVTADLGHLDRVLANLLVNAIRHTPADGVVTVVGRRGSGGIEVSVADECGGVSSDVLERAFEFAWQGEAARTPLNPTLGHGAGLGLAIVKGVVEAHGGRVRAENLNTQAGCRFAVVFP